MSTITDFLEQIGSDCAKLPRPLFGLEMFSREGGWITDKLAEFPDQMECWEINEDYLGALRQRLPDAVIRQVDSIEHARSTDSRFGLISMDNPQGQFDPYCEHFEALDAAAHICAPEAVVVFPVNIHPYRSKPKPSNDDYGMVSHDTWFDRRAAYYGRDAELLDLDFVESFYRGKFETLGCAVREFAAFLLPSEVPGHPDYFARCVAVVSRA